MKATKQYLQFITELKQSIIKSRYQAARLANREQLSLYLRTGQMLTKKIDAEKWGAKVIEQISTHLQKQLPGLKGFSYRNLKKMKAAPRSPLIFTYKSSWPKGSMLIDFTDRQPAGLIKYQTPSSFLKPFQLLIHLIKNV